MIKREERLKRKNGPLTNPMFDLNRLRSSNTKSHSILRPINQLFKMKKQTRMQELSSSNIQNLSSPTLPSYNQPALSHRARVKKVKNKPKVLLSYYPFGQKQRPGVKEEEKRDFKVGEQKLKPRIGSIGPLVNEDQLFNDYKRRQGSVRQQVVTEEAEFLGEKRKSRDAAKNIFDFLKGFYLTKNVKSQFAKVIINKYDTNENLGKIVDLEKDFERLLSKKELIDIYEQGGRWTVLHIPSFTLHKIEDLTMKSKSMISLIKSKLDFWIKNCGSLSKDILKIRKYFYDENQRDIKFELMYQHYIDLSLKDMMAYCLNFPLVVVRGVARKTLSIIVKLHEENMSIGGVGLDDYVIMEDGQVKVKPNFMKLKRFKEKDRSHFAYYKRNDFSSLGRLCLTLFTGIDDPEVVNLNNLRDRKSPLRGFLRSKNCPRSFIEFCVECLMESADPSSLLNHDFFHERPQGVKRTDVTFKELLKISNVQEKNKGTPSYKFYQLTDFAKRLSKILRKTHFW